MIWAIAIRNLWQHKAKTVIIGVLISVGIMITFAGNAFIDSMIKNISNIFIDYYTGDILVTSTEMLGGGVFGAQSDNNVGFPVIPILKDFDAIEEKVKNTPGVESVAHMLSGYAVINLDDGGMDYSCFFGIEPDNYFAVMNGIQIVDGRLLEPGEEGIILEYDTWKLFKETKNREFHIGELMQLNSFGTDGIKIREVPVVGIFKFPVGNDRMFPVSICDAKTLRYVLGRTGGVAEKVAVSAEETAYLGEDMDLDSLFGDDTMAETNAVSGADAMASLSSLLAEPKKAVAAGEQSKNWHYLIIKVPKGQDADKVIKELNVWFDENDLMARAQGWWISAMPDSLVYSGVQLLFNAALFILMFVSVIIIMNTLVVSVMERTSEIGTMRALGARKSFVTRMFVAETGFITAVFGCLGLLLGGLIILALNRVGIPTDNDTLRYLGGGVVLRPTISGTSVIMSLALMAFIALFSWIYPVIIALKISPLKAITTD